MRKKNIFGFLWGLLCEAFDEDDGSDEEQGDGGCSLFTSALMTPVAIFIAAMRCPPSQAIRVGISRATELAKKRTICSPNGELVLHKGRKVCPCHQ